MPIYNFVQWNFEFKLLKICQAVRTSMCHKYNCNLRHTCKRTLGQQKFYYIGPWCNRRVAFETDPLFPEFWLFPLLMLWSGMNAATSKARMTSRAPKTNGGPGMMCATNSSWTSPPGMMVPFGNSWYCVDTRWAPVDGPLSETFSLRSTWNSEKMSPNMAGPRPLQRPRTPVIMPCTRPCLSASACIDTKELMAGYVMLKIKFVLLGTRKQWQKVKCQTHLEVKYFAWSN